MNISIYGKIYAWKENCLLPRILQMTKEGKE